MSLLSMALLSVMWMLAHMSNPLRRIPHHPSINPAIQSSLGPGSYTQSRAGGRPEPLLSGASAEAGFQLGFTLLRLGCAV